MAMMEQANSRDYSKYWQKPGTFPAMFQQKKPPIEGRPYSVRENKYLKIAEYLRKWWGNIVWMEGTDREYQTQIMDFTEDAEHDDSADSAACVCRYFDKRSGAAYKSPFGG